MKNRNIIYGGGSIMRIKWYLLIIILFSSAIQCMEVPISEEVSTSEEENQDTIKIQTSDEKEFEVLVVVVTQSVTIKYMIEDIPAQSDVPLPLPNVLAKWFELAQGAMELLHQYNNEQEEEKLKRLKEYVQSKNLDAKGLAIFGATASFLDIGLLLKAIIDTLLTKFDSADKLRDFITWTRSEKEQVRLDGFLDSAKNLIRDSLILLLTATYITRKRDKITVRSIREGVLYAAVAISPDGSMLIGASTFGEVDLWDVINEKHIHTFSFGQGAVRSVSFNAESKILALNMLSQTDFAIGLFNVDINSEEFGNEIKMLVGHVDKPFSVAFSLQDPTILASGSLDGTVILWDIENPANKIIFGTPVEFESGHRKVHGQEVESIVFSPDGSILAAGLSNGTIKLWDLKTYKLIDILEGHTGPIYSVVFSPDGKILASASKDTTIRLWNVKTRKKIKELIGHERPVRSISFNKDGMVLVSGSFDATIRLWNVETGKSIGIFSQLPWAGYKDYVYLVVFSPDGRRFASGSYSHLKLWEFLSDDDVEILDQIEKFKPEDKHFTFEKMITLYFFAQHKNLQPLSIVKRVYHYFSGIQTVNLDDIYQSIDQETRDFFEKVLNLK